MKERFVLGARLLGLIVFVCAAPLALLGDARAAEAETAASREQIIVVGRVMNDAAMGLPGALAMASHLASKLGHLDIAWGDAMAASDNKEMIQKLRDGTVDVVSERPLSAFLFFEEAGAEILLREWRKGVPAYQTVFITRKDSAISSLAELRGRKIAFEDQGSTSAHLLPALILQRRGLSLVELSSARMAPPADRVGYVFAKSELNIATWVHRRLVDAGAFSNLDWDDPLSTPPTLRDDLEIVHTGRPFIRSLLLVRPGLRPDVKEAIKNVLLSMGDDPDAGEALSAFGKVTKYDAIVGEVKRSLDEAHEIYVRLRKEPR